MFAVAKFAPYKRPRHHAAGPGHGCCVRAVVSGVIDRICTSCPPYRSQLHGSIISAMVICRTWLSPCLALAAGNSIDGEVLTAQ